MFYEGLRLWEAHLYVFYEVLCTCFTCRGGSRGVVLLTTLGAAVKPGGSAKERPSRAWGEGEGARGSCGPFGNTFPLVSLYFLYKCCRDS